MVLWHSSWHLWWNASGFINLWSSLLDLNNNNNNNTEKRLEFEQDFGICNHEWQSHISFFGHPNFHLCYSHSVHSFLFISKKFHISTGFAGDGVVKKRKRETKIKSTALKRMNEFMDEYGKIFQIHLNKKKRIQKKHLLLQLGQIHGILDSNIKYLGVKSLREGEIMLFAAFYAFFSCFFCFVLVFWSHEFFCFCA